MRTVFKERRCQDPFSRTWFSRKLPGHSRQLRLQFFMPPADGEHVQLEPAEPGLVFDKLFDPRQSLPNLLPVLFAGRMQKKPQVNLGRDLAEPRQRLLRLRERRQRQTESERRLASGL